MATEKDLQAQLDIQNQINQAIKARHGLLKGATSEISAQVSMAQELCKALDCEDLEGMTERMEGFNEALKKSRESAGTSASAVEQLGKSAKSTSKATGGLVSDLADMAPKATAAVGALDAFKGVKSSLMGVWDTVTGLGSSLMNIGGSILGAVSSGIGFLASKAMEAGSANVSFANAMNKLNGTFGEGSAQAAQVTNAFNSMKSGSDAMTEGGRSLVQVFGAGPDGMAAALEGITELAAEMGPEFNRLGADFEKNAGQYMLAYKGLGLTGEAIANVSLIARGQGMEASEYLAQQAKSVSYLSKQYGVSAKQIGANLDAMAKDYDTFGGLSQTEMSATAAWAAKLGVEMKALQGITAKTDDFEGAATAASELAASFGMTVDAMEMMSADPAEKAEMVRQAFLETGKSFEDMSRQEKARMAEITGMGGKDLAGLFDPANADIGLDEMQAAAEDAADGAITQEEANMHLAKSITKLTEAFGGMTDVGGPMDAFLSGITDGIMKSPQMQKILDNFREVLMTIYDAGKEVGQLFMDLFPGMDQFATGLGELLNPEHWKKAMAEVVDAFKDFFNLLENDPEAAMEGLMDRLKTIFEDFFGGNQGASMMQDGMKKMWGAIKGIVGWMAKKLAQVMLEMVKALVKTPEFKKAMSILTAALVTKFVAGILIGAAKAAIMEGLKTLLMKKFAPGLAKAAADVGTDAGSEAADAAEQGVENQKTMIEKLRSIKASDITKAFKIGLYLVAFIMIAMTGLATAFVAVSKIISVLSPEELVNGIVGLGTALVATWSMVKLAQMMKAAQIGKAALGMGAAAVMFAISGVAYAKGLLWIAQILEPISLPRMAELMGMLGMALLATWGMILLGSLLVADGGMMLALTAVGMLAASVMFMIGAIPYAYGMLALYTILDGVPLMRMVEVMGMLGMALLATWGMIAVGALLGTALIPIGLAVVGSIAAGGLFMVMSKHMGHALVEFYNIMDGIDGPRLALLLANLIIALNATMAFLPAAAAFGLMLVLQPFGGGGIKLIKGGFKVLGELAFAMINGMAPALQLIGNLDVGDPKALVLKIGAIISVLMATQAFGGMAVAIAALDVIASKNGGESGSILEGAANFMNAMLGGITSMVQALTVLVAIISPADIPKLEAIGGLIGAIANLMLALKPPDALIEALKPEISMSWRGVTTKAPDVSGTLAAFGKTVIDMMKTMTELLPPFFTAIMTVDLGDDPEKAKIKMEAIATIITAIGGFAGDIGAIAAKIMCMNYDQQSWIMSSPKMADTLKDFKKQMHTILTAVKDHLPSMLEMVIESSKKIDGSEKSIKKMKVISMAISAVGAFASGIGAMADLVPEDDSWNPFADKPDLLKNMISMIEGIVGTIKDTLPGLVTALLAVNVEGGAEKKLEIIGMVIDEMAHFTSTIGQIAAGFGDVAEYAEFRTTLIRAMGMIKYLIDPTAAGGTLEPGEAGLKQVVDAMDALPDLSRVAAQMESMATFMGDLATFGVSLTAITTGFVNHTQESVAQSVGSAVSAYNQAGIELAKLRIFDINAVMEDVGAALSVRRQQVTVEDNGITIQMNLNVTMEADDLAEVLVDKKLVVAGTAMEGQGD